MKNYIQATAAALMVLFVSLGCGFIRGGESGPNGSNKTVTDKAVDTTVGRANTGVPECDQVLDTIEAELNNPDDNFVVKAAKATFLNRIKDSIRESLEKNPDDKVELTKTCKEFKIQLDKFKAEEQSKQ
ncbi:MAG: hypothetical protein IT173_04745 [Acidobacteria bacterium]|nr:hypothetical protein [Acidobacteriota bacterium]